MKIHNHLQTCVSCPVDGLVQHVKLALDVRVTIGRDNGPVTDGNSDVVQSHRANLLEIVGGDERVPVLG